jgi:hypothetical protein
MCSPSSLVALASNSNPHEWNSVTPERPYDRELVTAYRLTLSASLERNYRWLSVIVLLGRTNPR